MPHVSTFMYCENATHEMTSQGPKLQITGPLHTFIPAFVPGTFSFSIVFGVLDIDKDVDLDVRVVFKNSNEQDALIDTGNDIKLSKNREQENFLPKDMQGFMMTLDFRNVVLNMEGIYFTEIFIDGESLGSFPINVKGREKP